MLIGLPGIGKSQFCENYLAKELKSDFTIFHPVMSNPAHLMGLPFQVEENGQNIAKFLPLDFMRKVMEAKNTLLVLIDDVGQAVPIMQAAIMQLIEARMINGKKIPNCVKFVLASNDIGQGAGVSKILAPLKSRCSIFQFFIPVNEWIEYMNKNEQWHPIFASFFTAFPNLADVNEDSPKAENTANRRNWSRFAKVFDENDCQLNDISADVGSSSAKEFMAFLQTYKQMFPVFKQILKNWTKAETINESIPFYSLIAALVQNSNNDNCENFGKYLFSYIAKENNKEMAFFGLTMLANKVPMFQKSPTYVKAVSLFNS